MCPKPQINKTTDIHEFVHNKQQAFQRASEPVRRNLNEKQKRRNATYSFMAQHTKKGQNLLLYDPTIAVGATFKMASP